MEVAFAVRTDGPTGAGWAMTTSCESEIRWMQWKANLAKETFD